MRKRLLPGIFCLLLSGVCTTHADPLESVAKQLAKGASTLKEGRVAVLLFPYENGDLSSGSSLVSERLTTLIAQRKHINIIERSRLAGVLGEVRLEESGVTPSSGSAQPGGILNVDAVVTGTLNDHMDGETEVNARLIRLATGEILAAASVRIERTWDDPPRTPAEPDEDDNDTSHYVMHESPLIFTPQASRGGMVAPVSEAVYAAAPESYPTAAEAVQSPPAATAVVYASGPVAYHRRNDDLNRPRSAAQAQMLYAMGLTLDTQGHSKQAAHFYRQMLQETPAAAPLRERAQNRLAAAGSHSHTSD